MTELIVMKNSSLKESSSKKKWAMTTWIGLQCTQTTTSTLIWKIRTRN